MKENETRDVVNETKPDKTGFITKASAQYCDKLPLRAAIQAIPGLGGLLDTMLAGLGANWQYERLEDFIAKLSERLRRLEQTGRLESIEPDESLFDFIRQVFDEVIRARSEEKRKRFANLVVKQLSEKCDWDEGETACRLIGELGDVHIRVLETCIEVGESQHPLEGLRAATTYDKWLRSEDSKDNIVDLRSGLPPLPDSAIVVICSELVSRGLLRDAGTGRFDAKPMELFVGTDLARWLMNWIREPGSDNKPDPS